MRVAGWVALSVLVASAIGFVAWLISYIWDEGEEW